MILIFDFFETLLNTRSMDFNRGLRELWQEHYREKCSFQEIRAYGEELYGYMQELHRQGREFPFVKEELPRYAERYGGEPLAMTAQEEARFLLQCNEMESMPGIPEALAEFEKLGIPMYVLSNSGFTGAALSLVLERFGIGRFFERVWSSADFGRVKPCRELFEMALEEALADNPWEDRKDILYVGDTYSTDVAGARGADLDVIWMNPRAEDVGDERVHILKSPGQLAGTVRELQREACGSLLEMT